MIIQVLRKRNWSIKRKNYTKLKRCSHGMIYWNEQLGIKVMRLSEMFPHKSNQVEDYDYDFAISLMKEAGETAKD